MTKPLTKTNRDLLEEIADDQRYNMRALLTRLESLTEENETLRRWLGRSLRQERQRREMAANDAVLAEWRRRLEEIGERAEADRIEREYRSWVRRLGFV